MLGLLASALAIHIVPNLVMKIIKKTHKGHEIITATFAAGIELGRSGKKIDFTTIDLSTYGFGPESMIEYHIGFKIGKKISSMDKENQEIYIENLKNEIVSSIESLSIDDQREIIKTPFMNTFYMYSKGRYSKTVFKYFMDNSINENANRDIVDIVKNATVMLGALSVDLHTVMQPVICFIRGKIGTSKYGKKLLKKNFEKGVKGEILPKFQRAIIDIFVAPSVLDTMRIGNTLRNLNIKTDFLEDVI